MGGKTVIGVFAYFDDTVKAIEELLGTGIEGMEVYSPVPSHEIEELVGRDKKSRVNRFTVGGIIASALLVLLLAVGTSVLYPIQQSGMAILPLPPIALATAVLTVLGGIIATFSGFIFLAGLPSRGLGTYDPGVSNDKYAIVLSDRGDEKISRAMAILNRCGAEKVREESRGSADERRAEEKRGFAPRPIVPIVTSLVVLCAILAYGPFWIWYNSTGLRETHEVKPKPENGPGDPNYPRSSVPVGGSEVSLGAAGSGAALTNPLQPTVQSVKHGGRLYLTYCAVCHGKNGDGQGIMGSVPSLARFSKLDSAAAKEYISNFLAQSAEINFDYVGSQADGVIFNTITYGFTNADHAVMPSFKDALTTEERWDLINFIKRGF
ncbi:MAG: DUF3341 domain-containing protein [Chloroflexi bacterium]|nr:DUF3341 domain-containing protein [Chloroflexota bacterium]